MRAKASGSSSNPSPSPQAPPWLAGLAIGLAILGMAGSAMALGTGLALTQASCPGIKRR